MWARATSLQMQIATLHLARFCFTLELCAEESCQSSPAAFRPHPCTKGAYCIRCSSKSNVRHSRSELHCSHDTNRYHSDLAVRKAPRKHHGFAEMWTLWKCRRSWRKAHRGAAKAAHAGPSSCQRSALISLVLANLAVCFVSFRYLKQLREAEEASYQEAELDLSKLYEVPPGYEKTKAEPPIGGLSAEPIPVTRTEAETTTLPSKPGPPKPAAMPKPPAISPQKPPPQKQATEPPTLPPHEHPLQMTSTCPICGARKESPLLTTNLDLDVRCTWKDVSKSFLAETADDGQPKALSDAKEICINIGTSCGGVTCDKPGTHLEEAKQCTARSSTQPKSSPSEEVTFVKNCTYGSTCDEARPTRFPANPFSKDLKGAGIVVLAHNREGDFRRCLESLFAIPEVALFTVYISLDDPAAWTSMTAAAKQVAAGKGINIEVWQIGPRAFDATTVLNEETEKWMKTNTGKIAHHYWAVFEKSFMEKAHEHVIFVEEDLLFSPDFFALFRSTAGLFDEDPSLWCIGAWNDFGFKGTALDACSLQRTSYFPGLGFMLLRRAWLEVRKAWPIAPTMGWDYWMRVAFRAAGKECIVPQVSRSHHAAAKGSSVSTAKQIRLFEAMAFSDVPSTCDSTVAWAMGEVGVTRPGRGRTLTCAKRYRMINTIVKCFNMFVVAGLIP
eukprot:s3528_g6.t2